MPSEETLFRLIVLLSWALIILGVLKMVIWLVGELAPGAYAKIKSEKARNFMTGSGNRLLFGLGGFVTAALGGICLALGKFLDFLSTQAGSF